jgi:hypothetical protein
VSVSSAPEQTGTLLYPRLPHAVAVELFELYRKMSPPELQAASALSHPDATLIAVGGVGVGEEVLGGLRQEIREAAGRAGFPERGTQASRGDFDYECAEILHERMGIVPADAASGDVWAFFALVVLPDVAFWRFPDPPGDRALGTDLTRHTFARLWWRAYQLVDLVPGSGLSALRTISESEMNQLFERRNVGGNRALVRSIARALYHRDPQWSNVGDRALVRDSVKRIRRLLPFVTVEALDDERIDSVVRAMMIESARALATRLDESEAHPDKSFPTVEIGSEEDERGTAQTGGGGSDSLTNFDDVPLAGIAEQIAVIVRERGGLADESLVREYTRRFGVHVESDEQRDLIRRFAWSAKGHRFIERDEENELWLPGAELPSTVGQLGGWTISKIRVRAREMLGQSPNTDPFKDLVHEVYSSSSGRIPRLIMSLVGKIVAAARRETRTRPFVK